MIKLDPINEILGISGPWISHLILDEKKTNIIVLDQPIVYDEAKSMGAFALYEEGLINIKFRILILEISSNSFLISKKTFDYLYVEKFIENKISGYLAFHNRIKSKGFNLTFNKDNFIEFKV